MNPEESPQYATSEEYECAMNFALLTTEEQVREAFEASAQENKKE